MKRPLPEATRGEDARCGFYVNVRHTLSLRSTIVRAAFAAASRTRRRVNRDWPRGSVLRLSTPATKREEVRGG